MQLLQNSTWYDNIMSYHVTLKSRLRQSYHAVPSKENSEAYWLQTDVITVLDWLNDVTEKRHYAIVKSARSDKTTFAFHMFDALYSFKFYKIIPC